MSEQPNNPQAFPQHIVRDIEGGTHASHEYRGCGGMTLRDYFAAKAMQIAWDAQDKGYYEGDDADLAKCAYQIADAMLAERSKGAK